MADYRDTRAMLARAADVNPQTVTNYAKAGLLEYVISTDGRMLFKTGQSEKVRSLYDSNVRRRAAYMRAARGTRRVAS